MSMKLNMKGSSTTIRSVKQETREIKESVVQIESHMRHYNAGMGTLTNFVKVTKNNIIIMHASLNPDEYYSAENYSVFFFA